MNELALFAGAGGGILGGTLLGWRTRCAVEIDPYCRSVLFSRQRDGCLPHFPIWDDIRTFNGTPWRGHIDVISGGFPCQDISAAGQGKGITGERSGLVFEMLRIVDEVRPAFVFAENSPQLRTKGLATIIERFISMGYVGRVGVLGARDIGANHLRKRMWLVAYSSESGLERRIKQNSKEKEKPKPWYCTEQGLARRLAYNATDPNGLRGLQSQGCIFEVGQWFGYCAGQSTDPDRETLREQSWRGSGENGQASSVSGITDWWSVPRFAGVDDGVANRMDRIKATGNGQVPGVAALAWSLLTSGL